MINSTDDFCATEERRRPSHWRRLCVRAFLTLAGLGLATFAYLWYFTSPRVPTLPIHLIRKDDGSLASVNREEELHGAWFDAQIGRTESNSNFYSTAITSEPEQARFACARIAVFNRSDHLLMARVGSRLLDLLKPLAYLRQVDYYPAGFHAEEGQLAPDMVITLDLEKLMENHGLATSTLEATVLVQASNEAPDCRNGYTDGRTPPLVQFDWSGRLEHVSRTIGATSSAAKYRQAADDIAKQIAMSLTKEFEQRRKKSGPLPELCADFFPAYRKPVDLPLDTLGNLELAWSWHGLMNHNETLWRVCSDRPPASLIAQLEKRLQESGWGRSDAGGDASSPFLRIRRDNLVLQVYSPRADNAKPHTGPSHNLIYVHYLDRMTQAELATAIDRTIDRGDADDSLMLFERHWSPPQQQAVLAKLQGSQPRTPQAALTLANLYHRLGQDAESKRELLRAQILLRTVDNPAECESRLKALAKELGDEKLSEQPLDAQRLVDSGFQELTPGSPVAPQEVGLELPALFFVRQGPSNESLRTIAIRAIHSESALPSGIGLAYINASQNGRSWGAGGSEYLCTVDDAESLYFKVQPIGAKDRFRITAEWTGPGT